MRVTNHYGLPEAFVRAATPDVSRKERRGDSDISASELVGPAWLNKLKNENEDFIVVDASERVFAVFGTAFHDIMHRYAPPGTIAEHRYYGVIDGKRLSGKVDVMAGGILTDYKVCRTNAVEDGLKDEWEEQLNIYAYLLRKNNVCEVNGVQVIALLRDWSRSQFLRASSHNYPPREIQTVKGELWPMARAEAFIRGRIAAHENPTLCSPSERWNRSGGWAVMPVGGVRAKRAGFPNEEQAKFWQEQFTKDNPTIRTRLEYREGEDVRCKSYCEVWRWCPHGQRVKGVGDAPDEKEELRGSAGRTDGSGSGIASMAGATVRGTEGDDRRELGDDSGVRGDATGQQDQAPVDMGAGPSGYGGERSPVEAPIFRKALRGRADRGPKRKIGQG